jgi:hypothetical protein
VDGGAVSAVSTRREHGTEAASAVKRGREHGTEAASAVKRGSSMARSDERVR